MRGEVEGLREMAENQAKELVDDSGKSALLKTQDKASEWKQILATRTSRPQTTITLSQLETALHAKWRSISSFYQLTSGESSQRIHQSTNTIISIGLENLNDLLYNISLESPLLRDADLLDAKSVPTMLRGIHLINRLMRCVYATDGAGERESNKEI